MPGSSTLPFLNIVTMVAVASIPGGLFSLLRELIVDSTSVKLSLSVVLKSSTLTSSGPVQFLYGPSKSFEGVVSCFYWRLFFEENAVPQGCLILVSLLLLFAHDLSSSLKVPLQSSRLGLPADRTTQHLCLYRSVLSCARA